MIIAIEGIDGAGKATLTGGVAEELRGRGVDVVKRGFPAYGRTDFADFADDALHGRLGDTVDSAWAMALLFALDRRDLFASEPVESDSVLLLDRYVASNAAYSLARTGDPEIVEWISQTEFGRFALPEPDLTVYLQAPVHLAASRAQSREASDDTRTRDAYERDGGLQQRTADAYLRLAQEGFGGQWVIVDADAPAEESVSRVLQAFDAHVA